MICVCLSLSLSLPPKYFNCFCPLPIVVSEFPILAPMLSKSFQVPERQSTFVSVGHADKNYIVIVVVCRRDR